MTGDTHSSTHPPLPPTTEDDRFNALRLLRSRRVGPSTWRRPIAEHGTPGAALAALPQVARDAGVDNYQTCPEGLVAAGLKAGAALGARLVFDGDADYPPDLSLISDAPVALWMLGDASLAQRPLVALVGARNASSLGTRMTRKLAADLGAAGFCVVSGVARGVDAVAHDAALATGTIAVQAGGVDVIYPAENAALAGRIAETGLRLSEQPMGLQPQARHFPARNRIISGLVRAVIVVEAAAKSGSLITARNALDQGREVMAVPGHPFDARAAGCNMLIRDGAQLVRGAADVTEALDDLAPAPRPSTQPALDIPTPPPERRSLRDTAQLHRDILSRLGPSPMAEDQLIRDLHAAPGQVAPALVDLELDGQILRQPGGLLSRAV
ncbi:DNA-processing protein DprA [Roseovarius sp. SYSU LYC5161]|uniref:DNA-processing protein DprA n=1 Tax=Roseovarius halophilus (ex Wu et al. 2025) TaxID=3376060 RepID=UPI00399A2DC6